MTVLSVTWVCSPLACLNTAYGIQSDTIEDAVGSIDSTTKDGFLHTLKFGILYHLHLRYQYIFAFPRFRPYVEIIIIQSVQVWKDTIYRTVR